MRSFKDYINEMFTSEYQNFTNKILEVMSVIRKTSQEITKGDVTSTHLYSLHNAAHDLHTLIINAPKGDRQYQVFGMKAQPLPDFLSGWASEGAKKLEDVVSYLKMNRLAYGNIASNRTNRVTGNGYSFYQSKKALSGESDFDYIIMGMEELVNKLSVLV